MREAAAAGDSVDAAAGDDIDVSRGDMLGGPRAARPRRPSKPSCAGCASRPLAAAGRYLLRHTTRT
jgi:sulfate adenylyltransferase subunit 1 (EFTu-like GTPase family)